MSRLDHERVTDIFAGVRELPLSQRGAFLDSHCGTDAQLRREVEELLAFEERSSVVFELASQQIVEPDPSRIGPYELLEPIGEGGMAVVYKAQQHHPVRRMVAVKLVKLGMDTRRFVARFESERQALAMMDHPNVAQVYDAGSTETGRPYFVMEYVAGESILKWCDAHKLSVRERLELFIPVCQAVEHAHRKGIIHRDLKNSNVLVTDLDGRAVPKVIDFGVAKVLNQRLSDRTMFTERGQLIGTPEYMSPEQAERGALDVDTRTDVYSLGVLLYELIAGVQPIPSDLLRSGSYEQVQQIIRDTEPVRPSTRLGTLVGDDATRVASGRRTALPTLIRELRNELEWIPLKALRKDREQRYRSAAELADDIRNYLHRQPLLAGPESTRYKLGKFLRRHKASVAASVAMLLLLVGGIVATSWQAIRATRAEGVAQKQASIARSVNELMTGMIAKANRGKQQGDPNVTVRAVMDAAAAELNAGTTSYEPEVEVALRSAIGETYMELGLYEAAEPLFRAALEQRIRIDGGESLEVAAIQDSLAALLRERGDYQGAAALLRQVLQTRRKLLGNEHSEVAEVLNSLAAVHWSAKEFAAAEPLFHEALAMTRKVDGNEHLLVAGILSNLAALHIEKGDYDSAEPICREALALRRKLSGNESLEVAMTLSNLGVLLVRKGDPAAAEGPMRETLDIRRKLLGEQHPIVASSENNLAALLLDKGDYDDAEARFRRALEYRRKSLGNDHPDVLASMNNIAMALKFKRDYAAAESMLREALGRNRRVQGDNHASTLLTLRNLGLVLSDQGRFAEAEPLLLELYQRVQRAQVHPRITAEYVSFYGPCLIKLGRYQDAEQPLREAYGRLISVGPEKNAEARARVVAQAMAEVCDHTNRPEEAADWRGRLKQLESATQPAGAPS